MSRHSRLTPKDHKAIGTQLSRGVPFHQALRNVQDVSRRADVKSRSHCSSSLGIGAMLQQIEGFLAFISGVLELVGILVILGTYGFNLVGISFVFVYLLFWEFVGEIFSAAEHQIPRPLRILWRILEKIIEIVF